MEDTAAQKSGLDTVPLAVLSPSRGRPRDPNAQSPAQRSKAYRDRLKANGRRSVKCYLGPAHLAYLAALCQIHEITLAEAVGMSLTALIRGTPPAL